MKNNIIQDWKKSVQKDKRLKYKTKGIKSDEIIKISYRITFSAERMQKVKAQKFQRLKTVKSC